MMAEAAKTLPTDADVSAFLAALEPARRREEAQAIAALLEQIAGCPPVLWGTSIIGYGQYSYTYKSGRTGIYARIGFASRKANHVLYLTDGFDGQADLLAQLGKAATGVSCLYVKKLADIDMAVLAEMARRSWAMMAEKYPNYIKMASRGQGLSPCTHFCWLWRTVSIGALGGAVGYKAYSFFHVRVPVSGRWCEPFAATAV